MVTAGASLTAATTFANLIQASPSQAADRYVDVMDYSVSPTNLRLNFPDDYVFFQWDLAASGHSISDTSGLGIFDSSPYPGSPPALWQWVTNFGFRFWAAGTYHYTCKDTTHSPMNGTVRAPVHIQPVKARKQAMVQWGAKDLTADLKFPNLRYDVQVRKPGAAWRMWKNGVGSPVGTYASRLEGRHKFRARVRDITTQAAIDWSPVAVFKV